MTPDDLRARLLYQDANLLILDKPAGLAVHAGPRARHSLEQMLGALALGRPEPPQLAHRLDQDTSGCLVLGRHRKALRRLGRLFSAGLVEKTYWAVVAGAPPEPAGRIALPLLKQTGRGGWRIVADAGGQEAVTDYRVLGGADGLSWLELRPRTGRTHQIRVHCAASGFPVLGDPFYGPPPTPGRRLHLHARRIVVPLYQQRPPAAATAAPPAHMGEALAACGFALAKA